MCRRCTSKRSSHLGGGHEFSQSTRMDNWCKEIRQSKQRQQAPPAQPFDYRQRKRQSIIENPPTVLSQQRSARSEVVSVESTKTTPTKTKSISTTTIVHQNASVQQLPHFTDQAGIRHWQYQLTCDKL